MSVITYEPLSEIHPQATIDTMVIFLDGYYMGTLFTDRSKWTGELETVELSPLGRTMNANIITKSLNVWVNAKDIHATVTALSRMAEIPF